MARHRKIEDGLLRSARNDGGGKPTHTSAFSRRGAPELCRNFPPRNKMRAWGMPGAQCTRSLACKIKSTRGSHHRFTGFDPAFPHAMVLTVSFVISPVIGLSCHRHLR